MTHETSTESMSLSETPEIWELHLFVAGSGETARRTEARLENICEEHLAGRYRIIVVDVLKDPGNVNALDIIATPTLVRRHPKPERRIIGDLSVTDKVLCGLGIAS